MDIHLLYNGYMEKRKKHERGSFRFTVGTLGLLRLMAQHQRRTQAAVIETLLWDQAHTLGVVPMEDYHTFGRVGEPGVFDDTKFTAPMTTKTVG